MTGTATIREKLHTYIDEASVDKIEALFVLLKTDIDFNYTPAMITELYARRNRHNTQETQSYSVEESFQAIRNQSNK